MGMSKFKKEGRKIESTRRNKVWFLTATTVIAVLIFAFFLIMDSIGQFSFKSQASADNDVSTENTVDDSLSVNPVTTSVTSADGKTAVCSGDTLTFVLTKLQEAESVCVNVTAVSYKIGSVEQKIELSQYLGNDVSSSRVSYIIPNNPEFSDSSKIYYKAEYSITDESGVESNIITDYIDTGLIYYMSINKDDLQFTLKKDVNNSANSNSSFVRNGDALIVTCKNSNSSHEVEVSDVIITYLETTINDSSVIINSSEKDNFKIEYQVTVTDKAGQTYSTDKLTTNITYLAPITLESVRFVSNNTAFNAYAKYGSDLTFTARVNHAIEITSDVTVSEGNKILAVSSDESSEDRLSFKFEKINGFANQSKIYPIFTLADKAGNVFDSTQNISGSVEKNINTITYDSETPKISIMPKFDGFLNDEFTCTALFSDNNLYAEGMSFTYVNEDANTTHSALNSSNFVEGENTFRQSLALSDEGTFRISASVKDKANNSASSGSMVVTIDKTGPEITSIKISGEGLPVFKTGFVIKDYIDIDEKYINEIICKLSDTSGTSDWDISTPIENEGKKTISITAADMAGNTCSYVFEIYIDATPPMPIVKETLSDKELTSDSENIITKECMLHIELKEQQIYNQKPDEITSLKLIDENGNTVYDFISQNGSRESYDYQITDYGKYSLVLEAKDNAIALNGSNGNITGPVTYEINFAQGTILDIISENPALYYTVISIAAVGMTGFIIFLLIFLKRKKDSEDSAENI